MSILGGFLNKAYGNDSTIAGGQQNTTNGVTSAICGGANGLTGVSAQASVVVGGNGAATSAVTQISP